MYFLYTILGVTFLLGHLVYSVARYRKFKFAGSLAERFGHLPLSINLDREESIWIHAVSVGEVLTARALVPSLRARYPHLRIFLSTTTTSGHQVARRFVADIDAVFYFPIDLKRPARRTLRLVRPRLFIIMETELWPNVLRECRKHGVQTLLVNGRISSRAYGRYRLVRRFMRRVLEDVDRFCMQSDAVARRLVDLGADPALITVTGSLKFDSLELPNISGLGHLRDRVLRYFRIRPGRVVIVAASTMRGEDRFVLDAFRRVQKASPGALLIVAPRHPERFDEVERLARDEGFGVMRRSELVPDAEPKADVVILDTMGELPRLYQVATVVFVGGSLVDKGGHNILEPAIFGLPIIFGPHMDNFAEIAEVFLANEAAWQVASPRELEEAFVTLVGDAVKRARLGAATRALVEANRGAKDKTLSVIYELLDGGRSAVVRPFRQRE